MSYNWDLPQACEGGIVLDSLLMNLQPYRSDAQSPTGYQISQAMFAQNHADPTNTDPATWMWTGDSNPLSNQAGQANTTDNTVMDSHLLQEPEQDAKQIVAEIQQKTSEFEDRIENRITQVEERINNIQAGLKEETTRFCSEIDAHIKKLREWASEVKTLIDKATELQGTQ